MSETGLTRPGAMDMVCSALLLFTTMVFPIAFTSLGSTYDWSLEHSGLPALIILITTLALVTFFYFGYFEYARSKGYGAWLTFFLFLSNLPGFVVLLLLPDLKASAR